MENEDGGTEQLREFYEPTCEENIKPFVGQKFPTEEEAILFYRTYAKECGFDVRVGSACKSWDKTVNIWRYILCNREGKKSIPWQVGADNKDQKIKRRRISNRCDCMARLVIKYAGTEGFEVKVFKERHTHPFLADSCKQFLKINRQIDHVHQKFFLDCHRASIGPMKSFKLLKEVVGGYSHVGCTSVDFKNFGRDMRAHINGSDAQMILDTMHDKRERCSGFTFDHEVDDEGHLKNIFWVDPIAKRSFHVFGDVMSIDATYDTNKYGMRFLPFTGKDNHGKIISFGGSLIARENVESYMWVLEKFKACMEATPQMILTDQDPALKIAVERVLVDTRHRLCMWHITEKAPAKVAKLLHEDEAFMKRFNAIVWNENILPDKFEADWNGMITEFDLEGDTWFSTIYALRESWIPAYFLDCPMGGLLKTTSISESVNSFFGKYTRHYSNLVEFFMHYDNAIETQRYTKEQMDSMDDAAVQDLKTELAIEKHAASVYTNNIFVDVQKEILDACYRCQVGTISREGCIHKFEVRNGNYDVFHVNCNVVDKTFKCGCKMFERSGVICCHIFFVFKNMSLKKIPDMYLTWRWTKFAYLHHVHTQLEDVPQPTFIIDERKVKIRNMYTKFYELLAMVEGCSIDNIVKAAEGMTALVEMMRSGMDPPISLSSREMVFNRFFGKGIPEEVTVLPPKKIQAKGSGSRLKSRKEKAILQAKKPLRKCSRCKQMCNHDARNCKVVIDEDEDEDEVEDESE